MLMRKCVVCVTPPFDIAAPSVVHDCLRDYRASSYAGDPAGYTRLPTFATREWLDSLIRTNRELENSLAHG